jgi:transposase
MKHNIGLAPCAGISILEAKRSDREWVVEANGREHSICPCCGTRSRSRHSSYVRHLQDLPAQGAPVTLRLRAGRWRCRNPGCTRRIFTERLPEAAVPFARRTHRVADVVRMIGHSAGGRPAERLMERIGMTVSDDTILRHLKRAAQGGPPLPSPRVVGIDDWAWRKGQSYGTILVDLERRVVADVLPDRSASSSATWLARHPGIEIVSRDRCGLYAEAARRGAPKARQVADRFHLLQNLREAIETQLSQLERPI